MSYSRILIYGVKVRTGIHSPNSVHETPHSDTNSHLLRSETEKLPYSIERHEQYTLNIILQKIIPPSLPVSKG